MPPPETMERNHTITVWVKTGDDGVGEPVLAGPIEIKARFEGGKSGGFGQTWASGAYDALFVVAQEVAAGSIIYRGTLNDWHGVGSGNQATGTALLYQVERYDEIDDLKGRVVERELMCVRFKGKLPGA